MTSNKAFVPLWEVSRIEPIDDPLTIPGLLPAALAWRLSIPVRHPLGAADRLPAIHP